MEFCTEDSSALAGFNPIAICQNMVPVPSVRFIATWVWPISPRTVVVCDRSERGVFSEHSALQQRVHFKFCEAGKQLLANRYCSAASDANLLSIVLFHIQ